VELLGSGRRLTWNQAADALTVTIPQGENPAVDYAAVLKISL